MILVTGAAGFIGFHLCKRLVADGYEVVESIISTPITIRRSRRPGLRFWQDSKDLHSTGSTCAITRACGPLLIAIDRLASVILRRRRGAIFSHQSVRLPEVKQRRF